MKTTRLLSMILAAAVGLVLFQAQASAEEPPAAAPKQGEAKKDEAPADKTAKKKAGEKKEVAAKPETKPEEKK